MDVIDGVTDAVDVFEGVCVDVDVFDPVEVDVDVGVGVGDVWLFTSTATSNRMTPARCRRGGRPGVGRAGWGGMGEGGAMWGAAAASVRGRRQCGGGACKRAGVITKKPTFGEPPRIACSPDDQASLKATRQANCQRGVAKGCVLGSETGDDPSARVNGEDVRVHDTR